MPKSFLDVSIYVQQTIFSDAFFRGRPSDAPRTPETVHFVFCRFILEGSIADSVAAKQTASYNSLICDYDVCM